MDDRDVEAFGEVARVARRAPFAGIGREPDLVVRDQVERSTRRVALERSEVQRLGDAALARGRTRRRGSAPAARRSGRACRARVERSVCSARARPSTTGSTASRWLGFAASVTVISPAGVVRVPSAPRWYFTSPVPPSSVETTASIVRSPSNSRRIASYGRPMRVRENVEPAAVSHADHDLVRAVLGRRARSPRRASAPSRRDLRSRTASGRGTRGGGTARTPSTSRETREQCASSPRRRAACGTCPTRSPAAARRACS